MKIKYSPFKIIIIAAIALVLALTSCMSCKKEPAEPQLPAETQEGKNTFGCLINGEVWLPRGAMFIPRISSGYSSGCFYIQAVNTIELPCTYINLGAGNIQKDTAFVISNYKHSSDFQLFYYESDNIYYPINGHTGSFSITRLDSLTGIISGNFWFDAIDTTTGAVVQIREGRFDVKYTH